MQGGPGVRPWVSSGMVSFVALLPPGGVIVLASGPVPRLTPLGWPAPGQCNPCRALLAAWAADGSPNPGPNGVPSPGRCLVVCHHLASLFSSAAATLSGTLSGQPPALLTWSPLDPLGRLQGSGTPVAASTTVQVVPSPSPEPPTPATRQETLILPNTGLLGIPSSLVAKIRDGRFVNLGDLLPEPWNGHLTARARIRPARGTGAASSPMW